MPKMIRSATLLLMVTLVGCAAGPLAIELALTDQTERNYREYVMDSAEPVSKAFLRWRASIDDISMIEAETRDENLRSNPYRRDDMQAVALGAAVYAEHCMSCHGSDGKGGGPEEHPDHPSKDFTSGIARMVIELNDGTPEHWFDAVYDGKGPLVEGSNPPERSMPAYRDELSRSQIWLSLTYIASQADS